MIKPSKRRAERIAKNQSAQKAKRVFIWKMCAFIGGAVTLITGVVSAVPAGIELLSKPPTALIAIPRPIDSRAVSERMIILDKKLEQRIFYMADTKMSPTHFIVGLPYSITNVGEKRLQKVTVSFEFTHTKAGLQFDAPSFEKLATGPFFPEIPMMVANPSGRFELKRSSVSTQSRATISYNFEELLPNQESQFEFHFSPELYDVAIIDGGNKVHIGVYDVKINVISDTLLATQNFRLFILPADSEEDFSLGVKLFSSYFGCKLLCKPSIITRLIHSNTWLARKFAQEYEDVSVIPQVRVATLGEEKVTVLTPSGETKVNRFVQVLGGDYVPMR